MKSAATGSDPRPLLTELVCRYMDTFRAAWDRREELAGPQRLADERAFLPAAMALQETPPHPAPSRAAWTICALLVIAVTWSIVGKIDIVAVAPGRIVVSDRTKTLQPLETSVVKAIHVRDGDHVHAGQLLVELDATATHADEERVRQERNAAQGDALRAGTLLRALDKGTLDISGDHTSQRQSLGLYASQPHDDAAYRAQLSSEWIDIRSKLAKLDAEIALRRTEIATAEQSVFKLQAMLPLAIQREKDYVTLVSQGFMASHSGQDRSRERIEIERDLSTAQARRGEATASLKASELARSAFEAETRSALQQKLQDAELKTRQLSEEAVKAVRRDDLTQLTAPQAGTVQQLAIHTPGGVVTPAQPLLVLVPDDAEVTAEVVLENKDVGFVRVGQQVRIKLEAFPFTKYGTVDGNVMHISADAVVDEKKGANFLATIKLEQKAIAVDEAVVKLTPGLNLSAEISTGRRRVIDYFFRPAREHLSESLVEK